MQKNENIFHGLPESSSNACTAMVWGGFEKYHKNGLYEKMRQSLCSAKGFGQKPTFFSGSKWDGWCQLYAMFTRQSQFSGKVGGTKKVSFPSGQSFSGAEGVSGAWLPLQLVKKQYDTKNIPDGAGDRSPEEKWHSGGRGCRFGLDDKIKVGGID